MTINLPSVFKDGTATIANGGTVVTVAGALLVNAVLPGDFFGVHRGYAVRIASVDSDTQLTLANPWPGASQVAGPYEIMLQSDLARMQGSTRQLLERMQSGNLYSLAGLVGVADSLPIFTGAGVFGLISKADLTSGVDYDVQVDTLADRAAYNGNAAGFSVLVSNIGDGRTAIYSKKTNAPGDWSAPGYVTGPVGPMPTLAIAATNTLAPGSAATASFAPVAGGYTLTFGIPAGKGFNPRGAYAGATAYVLGDVVTSAGSSWVATAATTGNAPPVLPTTSNAFWNLVAAKGLDGTGIGDMLKATYDPTNVGADAFARGNHTGTEPISAVSGLQAALDAKVASAGLFGGLKNLLMNTRYGVNQVPTAYAGTFAANAQWVDGFKAGPAGMTLSTASGVVTITAGSLVQIVDSQDNPGGQAVLSWAGTSPATVNGVAVANGVPFTLAAGNLTVAWGVGTVSVAQLERGAIATPYEYRPFGIDFVICQSRYEIAIGVAGSYQSVGGVTFVAPISYKKKRATPVLATISAPVSSNLVSANIDSIGDNGARYVIVGNSSAGANVFAVAYIAVDARL